MGKERSGKEKKREGEGGKLKDMAEQENIGFKVFRISDLFLRKERSAGICAVESQLFAENPKPCYDSKGVHVIRCAGIYGEAETAASIIRQLTREQIGRASCRERVSSPV